MRILLDNRESGTKYVDLPGIIKDIVEIECVCVCSMIPVTEDHMDNRAKSSLYLVYLIIWQHTEIMNNPKKATVTFCNDDS